MKHSIISLLIISTIISSIANARILNVPEDYQSIQVGIDAAEDGDTVLVAPGVYYEFIDFNGKDVTVVSNFLLSEDEADISATIISGSNEGRVVTFDNGEGSNSKLIGFTIKNGWDRIGAGILISDSSPTLSHLIIEKCRAVGRGGAASYEGYGAGIFIFCGSPSIDNTIVRNCHAEFNGGGICMIGPNITLTKVACVSNIAFHSGGGLYFDSCQQINLENVTLADNNLEEGDLSGAGMILNRSNVIMNNSILYGNRPESIELYVEGGIRLSRLSMGYNDLEGGLEGIVDFNDFVEVTGELYNDNPLFDDNYHLTEDSPCIDAGDPESRHDSDGTITDLGAFYYPQDNSMREELVVPFEIQLSAYPNPFNSMTRIRYQTGSQTAPTRLAVSGMDGRLVADLLGSTGVTAGQGIHPAAEGGATESSVIWNAEGLPGGIYFVRLEAGKEVRTMKVVLIR